jgi:hypothetical protein
MFQTTPGSTAANAGKNLTNFIAGTKEATDAVEGLNRAVSLADANVGKILGNLGKALASPGTVLQETAKLQDLSYKLARESMGNAHAIGDALNSTMAEATYMTAEFGVSLDDNLNLMKQINEVMQVNTLLTSEQITGMQVLAKNAGVTSAEIVTITEGFATMGQGTDYAIEKIGEMQEMARSYGINVGQFMKGIGQNIKMLSSYNFKDGIEGFSRMVAKAQALRMDVSKTFSMAEGLLEPEKAIETAAGFQMLGGAVGDLGDPFKLLHMAQTDAEGLQDSIIDMAESATVFNEKTGEFDIPVTEMYRLREAAKLTGMDYQTLTETAIKSAERTKKLDMIGGMGYDEETADLIANMGEIKGGRVQIAMKAEDDNGQEIIKMVDAANLTSTQLEQLAKQQNKENMSQEDIARGQLSALETLKGAVDGSKAMTVVMGTKTKGVTDALDSAKAYGQTLNEELDKVFSPENISDYGSSLTAAIKAGFENEDLNKAFTQSTGRMVGELISSFENAPTLMKQKLEEDNVFKDMNFNEAIGNLMGQIGAGINGLTAGAAQGLIDTIVSSLGLNDAQKTALENNFKTVENTMDSFTTVMSNVATFLVGLGVDSLDDWIAGDPGTGPGTAPTASDFIWRPGEPVQHFDEDDLLIGGTDLMGEKQERGYNDPNMEGLTNLGNTLTSFVSSNINQNKTESVSVDYDQMVGRAVAMAQEKLTVPVIPETTNSFEKISEMGRMIESAITNNTNNKVGGDVNLNVGGKIDLSVDGRNLPQNISSEQLANEIVNNPNFTSKLMTIFTDKNNTYSV